jgi:hypothetical protein
MKTINLNDKEIELLMNSLDLAVKQVGLNGAQLFQLAANIASQIQAQNTKEQIGDGNTQS